MDSYFRARDILDKAMGTDSYFQIKSILFGLKAADVVEGRHASNQTYSAEYQKYVGMQMAMREVLEYFSKFEL